jgi:hypothetical protein
MPRHKLEARRPSVTRRVSVTLDGGKEVHVLVTVGFDAEYQPKEIFCADFKAGTALHAIITDACILMSRLLQHGNPPADLLDSMGEPRSLIGRMAQVLDEFAKEHHE